MSILQRMISGWVPDSQLPRPDFLNAFPWVNFGGNLYPLGLNQTLLGNQEAIHSDMAGIVQGAYRRNGVVFAVELARLMLFAQARFQYQRMAKGRPGDLWGDASLSILEKPWTNGTTGDLLTRMLMYNDLGSDAFIVRRGDTLRLPRPDWVTLAMGSYEDPNTDGTDIDAEVLGIFYHPGGPAAGREPDFYAAEQTVNGRTIPSEFAHFALIPDPMGFRRGISWLTAVMPNVASHNAATAHKLKFFENGATPNMVVSNVPGATEEQFDKWTERFRRKHEGIGPAYKTLFLSGSTTATVVGSNFQQMDFRTVQGQDEITICNAGNVPATVIGISEGLQGSSLNAGNYTSAFRRFADMMARPAWQNAAGSLESILPPPHGSRLWYDDRDIPALKDDIKDRGVVLQQQASSIQTLWNSGFKPDAVVAAVVSGDLSRLEGEHTGLFPVQGQAPGSNKMPQGEVPGEQPEIGTGGPEAIAPVTPPPTPPVPPKKPRSVAETLEPLTERKENDV